MSYLRKKALAKLSPGERHPYGREKKKYRKRMNGLERRLRKNVALED